MSLQTDQCWQIESEFLPFVVEIENDQLGYTVQFRCVDSLPPVSEKVLYEDACYRVHPDFDGKKVRTFFDPPRDYSPYAVALCDYTCRTIQVQYLEKGSHCVSELHNSFAHLCFEGILIHEHRLCLHAACVRTEWGGILFSGPSGIGKSTQAQLWCDHRGAVQINGDRPVLSRSGSGWLAWGSPYAGSSNCHVNESCPVRAIVMLRQAGSCSLRKLSSNEAFRAIWSGLTVPSWDAKATETACDLALELCAAVPVYEFGCTPDVAAVEFLEQGLGKDGAL